MPRVVFSSMTELVGQTPLVELGNMEKNLRLPAKILAKMEYFNPGGSVKDRVALSMIRDAEKSGALKPGGTIIEPTSGNTGIGLAAVGAALGYKVIVVMPESMSMERRQLVQAYGAKLVLTPAAAGMRGAIEKAEDLKSAIPGAIIAGQFVNPANPQAHRETTGPEIYQATAGDVDIFVAGVGTGGTITGVGEYLKNKKPGVRVVAVEPDGSPVLSGGKAGPHKIQGIGAGFIPETLNISVVDEIMRATADEAFAACRQMARTEGLLIGISSGAVLSCSLRLAALEENRDKTIVALLPDNGERYLSTGLFA